MHAEKSKDVCRTPIPLRLLMATFRSTGLHKSDKKGAANFGSAVALNGAGNSLAVGAYTNGAGSAGINNSSGKASNPTAGMLFGENLSLSPDGKTLVVSASREDSSATDINVDGGNHGRDRR